MPGYDETRLIVNLESLKFKAGDMMSKSISNNTKYVSVNTVLQTLNVPVGSLVKRICSPEFGVLQIPILSLSMQRMNSVSSNQLPQAGLLNNIYAYHIPCPYHSLFSHVSLFLYSLKVTSRMAVKKIISRAQQRAFTRIPFRKMSNLGGGLNYEK